MEVQETPDEVETAINEASTMSVVPLIRLTAIDGTRVLVNVNRLSSILEPPTPSPSAPTSQAGHRVMLE